MIHSSFTQRCILALVIGGLNAPVLFGQNLVPNASFETFTACPDFASQLDKAFPWFNPTQGTPEYYNACADYNNWVSVPAQPTGGYQAAYTGSAYSGIFTYRADIPEMREYLSAPLTQTLVAGECYYFEMFVNLPNDQRYAINRVGAYISQGAPNAGNVFVLPFIPQVESDANIVFNDTARWERITGLFTAQGGEDHITIGNFRSDADMTIQDFNPAAWYNQSSYLLVDAITLIATGFSTILGNDTTYCDKSLVLLDASLPNATYTWQNGSAAPSFEVTESGTYSVEIQHGACIVSDTITVSLLSTPRDALVDTVFCTNDEATLRVPTLESVYLWSNGDSTREITVSEPGLYWVNVANVCGSVSDSLVLDRYDCACAVFLPDAFTPNRDALNDHFFISVDCPKLIDFKFTVFNRFGELIYFTESPEKQWDGTSSGKECPPGIYSYTLSYFALLEGRIVHEDYSGRLQLIR